MNAGQFPETAWSMISQLHKGEEQRRQGLETLCGAYWGPICSFLRWALRVEPDVAQELTQAFFAWVIESPVLTGFDSQKGSFRSFLKGLLHNFVRNHRRGEGRLKRGGGQANVALDAIPQGLIADSKAKTPEEVFDEAWVDQLIDRATNRVRDQLSNEVKLKELEIFEAYEFPPPGVLPTYGSVAKQLDVSANTVRHQLFRVRERVRVELRAELRDTVSSSEQLEDEWRQLFAGPDA